MGLSLCISVFLECAGATELLVGVGECLGFFLAAALTSSFLGDLVLSPCSPPRASGGVWWPARGPIHGQR